MHSIKLRTILAFMFLLTASQIVAQAKDTLQMKEIYIENDLVYRQSNDERFTGVAQQRRKNGHLTYEEVYKDGVILEGYEYYNGKGKFLYSKTIYNRYKLWVLQKEYTYGKSKANGYQMISFDENGKKILEEGFENEKLVYRCEFSGKKKHGKEMCYTNDGDILITEYMQGKRVRKKK